jgi:hypothetical protein
MSEARRKALDLIAKGKASADSYIDPKSDIFEKAFTTRNINQAALAQQVLKNTGIPIPGPRTSASKLEDFFQQLGTETHPELKNMTVDLADLAKENANGIYYSGDKHKWIELQKDMWKRDPEKAVGTLMHELGHAYDDQVLGQRSKPISENLKLPESMSPSEAYEIMSNKHHVDYIPGKREVGSFGKGALESLRKNGTFRAETGPLGAVLETLKGIYGPETPEPIKANPEAQAKIAQAYEQMQHNPNDPKVKAAYEALINEVTQQYDDLVDNKGLKVTKIADGSNPYPNSAALVDDVKKNNHIAYFPTEIGYGSDDASKITNHPLLQETGRLTPDGKPMLANDMFRVVHDYYGHVDGENKFGPTGEERAFQNHRKMLSPEAQKALASETRGQNSWVNFGPNGEANRANPANTVYAEQKAGLLPDDLIEKPLQDIAEPRFAALNKLSKVAAKAIAPVGVAAMVTPVAADLKEGNPNTALTRAATMALPIGTEGVSDKLMQEAQIRDKSPELLDPTYQQTLKNIAERRLREGRSPVIETFSGQQVDGSATSDSDIMNKILEHRRQMGQG